MFLPRKLMYINCIIKFDNSITRSSNTQIVISTNFSNQLNIIMNVDQTPGSVSQSTNFNFIKHNTSRVGECHLSLDIFCVKLDIFCQLLWLKNVNQTGLSFYYKIIFTTTVTVTQHNNYITTIPLHDL